MPTRLRRRTDGGCRDRERAPARRQPPAWIVRHAGGRRDPRPTASLRTRCAGAGPRSLRVYNPDHEPGANCYQRAAQGGQVFAGIGPPGAARASRGNRWGAVPRVSLVSARCGGTVAPSAPAHAVSTRPTSRTYASQSSAPSGASSPGGAAACSGGWWGMVILGVRGVPPERDLEPGPAGVAGRVSDAQASTQADYSRVHRSSWRPWTGARVAPAPCRTGDWPSSPGADCQPMAASSFDAG